MGIFDDVVLMIGTGGKFRVSVDDGHTVRLVSIQLHITADRGLHIYQSCMSVCVCVCDGSSLSSVSACAV